jgi:hypothetical protein
VPQVGFRSANGLRMPERTIVRQGERALAVVTLVSSDAGTELSFEIQDDRLEDACIVGKFDQRALFELDVRLRDDEGNSYARSEGRHDGIGIGHREFGFFHRELTFEPLRPDVRRVVLEVDGAVGAWTVPVQVLPITETGVARQHAVDRTATKHGIGVRLVGIALRDEETVVELDATWTRPIAAIHGIGAMIQRQGDDRLVLVDAQGRRYEEDLSRETTRRPRDKGEHTTAKFPRLPADATELTLIVPSVVVEESDATLEFAVPMDDSREVLFGPYPMRLGPASLTHDLIAPPGKPPEHGLRFVLGPLGWHEDRRALRPMRILLDGVEHKGFGWGWHPDPDMRNFTVTLKPGASPRTVTLARPMVSIRGPWEIRFELPESPTRRAASAG